jgi:radical SAM superfamily enzyme YgiQ (UPF0313 family)
MMRKRALLIQNENFQCDECSAGRPAYKKLSSQILLACQYCRNKGLDVDLLLHDNKFYNLDGYSIICAWIPLLEAFYSGIKYLERAKRENKITIMVLNDPFEGIELEAMQRFEFIDFTIRLYEREYTLGLLLEVLNNDVKKTDFTDIPGLMYRRDGDIIDTGKRRPFGNLFHLPSTASLLKSIDLSKYREIYIEAGRGCHFSCSFCFYCNTKSRKRKIDDLISELSVLQTYKQHISLHDLNMLADKSWTKELCDKIIKNNITVFWSTDARLDECTELGLLKKMYMAGCRAIAFGLESTDQHILTKIDKKINLKDLTTAVKNCKLAGIEPEINIMYGFPWESENSLKGAESILRKFPVSTISIVRPLRGTKLYDDFKNLGLLDRDLSIDDYVFIRNKPIANLLNLSKDEISKWHRKFEVLASRNFIKREIRNKGFFRAMLDFINIKRSKLINLKKIISHIFIR